MRKKHQKNEWRKTKPYNFFPSFSQHLYNNKKNKQALIHWKKEAFHTLFTCSIQSRQDQPVHWKWNRTESTKTHQKVSFPLNSSLGNSLKVQRFHTQQLQQTIKKKEKKRKNNSPSINLTRCVWEFSCSVGMYVCVSSLAWNRQRLGSQPINNQRRFGASVGILTEEEKLKYLRQVSQSGIMLQPAMNAQPIFSEVLAFTPGLRKQIIQHAWPHLLPCTILVTFVPFHSLPDFCFAWYGFISISPQPSALVHA